MPGFTKLIPHIDNMSLNRHVEEHLLYRDGRMVGAVPIAGGRCPLLHRVLEQRTVCSRPRP